MSLNTVTLALDNKLRSLRGSMDENTTEEDEVGGAGRGPGGGGGGVEKTPSSAFAKRRSAGDGAADKAQQPSLFRSNSGGKWKAKHLSKNQPLTLFDDSIPYADESPERSLSVIPLPTPPASVVVAAAAAQPPNGVSRLLPLRQNSFKSALAATPTPSSMLEKENQNNSDQGVDGLSSTSSDETDTSTTSSVQLTVDPEMLRKMNRILTNLERNTTKMNRSLSLNYKNVQKGGECCCHVNHRVMQRGNSGSGLTKDEKTDKNNMKKRHSQEGSLNSTAAAPVAVATTAATTTGPVVGKVAANATTGSGGVVTRRYGNRSIRRRHTVGGTHDYSPRGGAGGENYRTPCHNYVMDRSSSPE